MKRRCIFHIPYKVDLNWPSGSQIRPINMIKAFEQNGYDVEIIMGYGEEREKKIKKIKSNIKEGIKYDFLYSESSTEPTLLTEKNHIPLYPFLDFGFLKYCKNHNIKIGLFYRDIHWRFSQYKKNVNILKRIVAYTFYFYDLLKYKAIIDILYLPSKKMYRYIPIKLKCKVEELPPAFEASIPSNEICEQTKKEDFINIFYVGGVNPQLYNLEKMFSVINNEKKYKLTVCCRENEWKSYNKIYKKYIGDKIKIIHKKDKELNKYFAEADVVSLFVEPQEYWKFAMPVKLFTYISYKKPIICCKNTAVGKFVMDNSIGWEIDYSEESLSKLLEYLSCNNQEIYVKKSNITKIIDQHDWKARARKVINDLI
ncbi:TPA: glycosyltransferase family 1 protein [Clostridium botulinum]|uniref:glycosyltransferase family 1 protein n=1 Tax=Clostridium botulinum TaxID=1491 RepID=UPI001A91CCFA|nr:glycosyltransferase family 1 protein [Clostridium botulinum]MBO0524476.1 glycosyltransferase family 1 protein [Clostridium botulinum]MBO0527327.1 glycosyltransferase family 1 protein [Clostridium botulinum]MBO0530445.1 glycosyltransferase family 1 protein [Clostridium botulinum]MBO0547819.1 glycosyltransferase family 1 protein [Clostridium botulinum]MBO0554896.1 glycosyltransferase family 1 protein [Clostridium botulinum]